VIYDRIEVTDAAKRPRWLFHSLREPAAFGNETSVASEEIGPQQLQVEPGRLIPHPDPGGHFRMSGAGFWVESGSPHNRGDGWLRVQTLMPGEENADRIKIGGRGHDFEVAGVQYGVTDEGYAKSDDPYAVQSTIGLEGWRVELRAKTPATAVEFLHVLQTGTGEREAAQDATRQSSPTTQTVTIESAGKTIVLTLRRTGRRGGSVRITETAARNELCDEALPESVEDHYRHHKDDPNYSLWVTDPRYRVTIEPTDEDRALAR
ncbi:MAG: hypothetical protein PVH68_20940, partial [Armatimonadota bacterium]|jgi:hypothetical protein